MTWRSGPWCKIDKRVSLRLPADRSPYWSGVGVGVHGPESITLGDREVQGERARSRCSARRAEGERTLPTHADADDRRGSRRSVMVDMPVSERCAAVPVPN